MTEKVYWESIFHYLPASEKMASRICTHGSLGNYNTLLISIFVLSAHCNFISHIEIEILGGYCPKITAFGIMRTKQHEGFTC